MKINTIRSEKINEEVYNIELENGLKIFYMPKKDYVKKYAIYSTHYGSIDNVFTPIGEEKEITVPEGIAHFLEHKLFEEPNENIFDKFAELGSYVNAFTSNNQTAFLFSCVDRFNENLKILIDFVQNPYFTDENVEKEKGIIRQEIKMYNDSPNWRAYTNCLSGMYINHPVRIDIAGTVDSIKEINKELLYKCYNTFYNPSNMLLFIIGDIDFDEALKIIQNSQKNTKGRKEKINKLVYDEPLRINKKIIEEKLNVNIPLFNIGFKDMDLGLYGEKLVYKEICTNLLLEILFSSSTDFYQQLYSKGLINDSFGFQYVGYKDYGFVLLVGESPKPKEVYELIIGKVKNTIKEGISEEDIIRAKRKLMGYYFMDLNSIENIATSFINYFYKGHSMLKYLNVLEKIKKEDMEERCRNLFNEKNCCISIVNPR